MPPRSLGAAVLAACLVVSCTSAPPARPTGGSRGPAAPSPIASTVDTSGWRTERMATLGYSLDVPPAFERVAADTGRPIPSFAIVQERDADQASQLQVTADRLATSPGVFGDLGLWAVDPATFEQIGVLAGSPYRVAASDLHAIAQASVDARASPIEPSRIDTIQLPAGDGFLASYRDSHDLSEHREIHLRTPNGRYLLVVLSAVGVIEAPMDTEFLAIAGSVAPLSGDETGDRPAPSVGPDANHADAALEQTLPDAVGGVPLQKRSLNGEDLIGGSFQADGTIVGALGDVVKAPGDLSFALAVPVDDSRHLLLAAYRSRGIPSSAIEGLLKGFPKEIWSPQAIGGHDVLVSVAGTGGSRTYLRLAGDTLFQIDTTDSKLATEALAALP